jgi:oxygen-dependent protoporphyrinogen oxidase
MKVASVAVVGAGVAGLSAALELVRSGVAVTLYERKERAGGSLRSEELEGAIIDSGVQLLSSAYRTFFRLAAEAGVSERLVRTPGRDALWRDGEAHGITYGSARSMGVSSALPALLKLKIASKYLPYLATRCRHLDASDPAGTGGAAHDGESIAEWGERELGHAFVELMAYPFLGAYYGAEPEATSAGFYHALARMGLDVKLYALAGGMGVFGAAVLDRLRAAGAAVRLGDGVEAVSWSAAEAAVRTSSEERSFDAVILALPAHECGRLLAAVPDMASWLGETKSTPATALALVLAKRLRTRCFGIAVPRTEPPGRELVAACVESAKEVGLVPAGREAIVAFPAPAIAAELAAAEPLAVVNRLMPSLEVLFGPLEASVLAAKVYRQASGYTQFPPGTLRRLARFEEAAVPSRIALAGDWRVAPTVEGAAVSGQRAAARVQRAVGSGTASG